MPYLFDPQEPRPRSLGAAAHSQSDEQHVMTEAHTPTPWSADYEGGLFGADGSGLLVCGVEFSGEPDESPWAGFRKNADAAFIVRAVNAHDELVKTLELVLKRLCELNRDDEAGMRSVIANALAKARA